MTDLVIVLVAPSGGGTLTAVEGLIRLWRDEGRRVCLLAAAPVRMDRLGPDTPGSLRQTLELVDLPWPSRADALTSPFGFLRSIGGILRKLSIIRREVAVRPGRVVLSFLPGTSILTRVACLGTGARVVVCERNDPTLQVFGWHVRVLRRMLYPGAAAITVNTPKGIDWSHRTGRGTPVHLVLNPPPFDVAPATPERSSVVLSVGRLVPQKDHATLLRGFARALSMAPADAIEDWRLRIVGEGPQRGELERLAAELEVSDKVDLPGVFAHITAEYAVAALFVLPSRFEGESNALVEAAAAGLPCIVAAEAGSSDGVRRFDTGDVEGLAGHLRDLMSDPNKRRSEGRRARECLGVRTPAEVMDSWSAVLERNRDIGSLPDASAGS